MKQAYSPSADNQNFNQRKLNIEKYLLKKNTWKIDTCFSEGKVDLIEKINKIISSMVITIASAVAEVERISVLLTKTEDKTLLTIQILNDHKPLSKSLVEKLNKEKNDNLTI